MIQFARLRRLGGGLLAAVALAAGTVVVSSGPAAAYAVRPGDTLWAIARAGGTSVARIAADNHLPDPSLIIPGQVLALPGEEPPAAGGPPAGPTYTVRPGDTLWAIASAQGTTVARLAADNAIVDPALIRPGQVLRLPPAGSAPAAATAAAIAPPAVPAGREPARALLRAAAAHQRVDPYLVLAVAYWESGWNQAAVSREGAIGLMQLMPATARWASVSLLHRPADPRLAADNAELGAALLAHHLADFGGDRTLALAAYYQGAAATRRDGVYPSSRAYVNGILALRERFARTA